MQEGLSTGQAVLKRGFDVFGATIGLALTFWLIALAWLAATVDTRANGFFTQQRVGRNGRVFRVIKIRTMRVGTGLDTTVTTGHDPRITPLGRLFRRAKIDELPQLINVLLGQMSFVGPRPDVPGYADALEGRVGLWGPQLDNMDALLAERPLDEVCALQWQRCVDASAKALANIDPERWIEVGYEDFVREPAREMERVLSFADVEADSEAIQRAVSGVRSTSIGKGRATLDRSTRDRLEALVYDTLSRYGYTGR